MQLESFQTTGSEIETNKSFKLPFLPGEKVRHLADGEVGIVAAIVVFPHGCLLEVGWGANRDHAVFHFEVESIGDDCAQDCRVTWEFPWPWGHKVAFRVGGSKFGIIIGYRISERGMCARVSWAADHWDWHSLCELEEPQ